VQKIKSLNTVVVILTTSCNTDNSVFFTQTQCICVLLMMSH